VGALILGSIHLFLSLTVSIKEAITKRINVTEVISKLESFEATTQTKNAPNIIVNILDTAFM